MRYIVVEGPNGSGKTTVARELQARLADKHSVIYGREPGGIPHDQHPLGKLTQSDTKRFLALATDQLHIRSILATHVTELQETHKQALYGIARVLFFMQADLASKVADCLVADRSFISGLAYAVASGVSLDNPCLREVVMHGMWRPNVLILLDAEPDVLIDRVTPSEGENVLTVGAFDACSPEFVRELRDSYEHVLRTLNNFSDKPSEQPLNGAQVMRFDTGEQTVREIVGTAMGAMG